MVSDIDVVILPIMNDVLDSMIGAVEQFNIGGFDSYISLLNYNLGGIFGALETIGVIRPEDGKAMRQMPERPWGNNPDEVARQQAAWNACVALARAVRGLNRLGESVLRRPGMERMPSIHRSLDRLLDRIIEETCLDREKLKPFLWKR